MQPETQTNPTSPYSNPAFANALQPSAPLPNQVASVDLAHAGMQTTPAPTVPVPPASPVYQAQAVASSQELHTPNNKRNILIIVCIAVLLLLVGVVGYMMLSSGGDVVEEQVQDQPADTPSNTPAAAVAPKATSNKYDGDDTTPTLTGTVDDRNATVSVSINGKTYAGNVSSNGTWAATITDALAAGTHTATVTFVSGTDSNVTSQVSADISVQAPAAPAVTPSTGQPSPTTATNTTPRTGPVDE